MKRLIILGIFTGSLALAGGLDRDQIADVIQRGQKNILPCYENQLTVYPQLNGRVSIEFFIELDGTVQDSKIHQTTLHNDAAEKCIVSVSKTWIFPKPTGAEPVHVTYPFIFKKVQKDSVRETRTESGFKLTDVKPGSIYDKLGLKKGDVIKELNGTKIDSPEAARTIATTFKKSPSQFKILIERNGKQQTLHVKIN